MNPIILAHRGSQTVYGYPENTIPAFQEARELGAHGIELDIRLTADREIIVFHDAGLYRQFGKKIRVSQLKLPRLKEFHFTHNKSIDKISIPTLKEVFEQFGSDFYYNLEIKPTINPYEPLIKNLIQLVEAYHLANRVWISSFDPVVLRLWYKYKPEVPAGYLFDKMAQPVRWVGRRSFIKLLHPKVSMVKSREKLRKLDKKLCFWTVNTTETYREVEKYEPVAIISDNLTIFSDLLKNRYNYKLSQLFN